MNHRTIPIFLAFLCMGFADFVGTLSGQVGEEFQLSHFVALLIPFTGLIMFGFLSIPLGVLQDRIGKKPIFLIGLAIALIGMLLPLLQKDVLTLVFLAILLLGAGASVLQVAGNPIMRDVSDPEKYSRNLTLGQSIKAFGTLSGSLIPFVAHKWWGLDYHIVFPIYSAALLVTLIAVAVTGIKEKRQSDAHPATLKSCLALLGNSYVLLMVMAIFVYVGAEVCVRSGIPVYLKRFGVDIKTWGVLGTALVDILILIGRFSGSLVLNWISAQKFLLVTILVSLVGLVGLLLADNRTFALVSIVFVGLGFANIFPLVFSIAVNRMPERSNEITGLMITAIVGGAVLPPLMGILADYTSVTLGFLVPLAAALYLTYVSLVSLKLRPIAHEI
jgi:fucose permease